MTLLREVMLVVIFILLGVFSANFVLAVLQSKSYLETQLQAHAEDTATSLGLSITTAFAEQDDTNLELLTAAVFDRGYYSEIKLIDIHGEALIHRKNDIRLDDTPEWFVTLLDLPNPIGYSEINQGWTRLGKLSVRAHSGQAYRDLWQMTKEFAYLFTAMIFVSYGFFALILRAVMRPLKEVEEQANEIVEHQFSIVESIPKTRELRRVVEAMNRMSKKLKALFENQVELTEKLRLEAKTDAVTGLMTKREFDALAGSILSSEQDAGSSALYLLQVRDFALINEHFGFSEGDDLLAHIASRLRQALSKHEQTLIARRHGADFSVFASGISLEQARVTLERCFQEVASLRRLTGPDSINSVHICGVFAAASTALEDLLSAADSGLRQAQAGGVSSSQFLIYNEQDNPISAITKQALQWRKALLNVIAQQNFLLYYQPVYRLSKSGQDNLLANEVFVRIELDDEIIPAGVFMPMAERFGMLLELDKLIIIRALESLSKQPATLVLNLSTYSLQSERFVSWLIGELQNYRTHAERVVFEIPEHAIHLAYSAIQQLNQSGRHHGYRFSVDHFGTSGASFAYLRSLDLSYIKIDRSFTSSIHQNTDNQFFIRSVIQIAATREILVIAEGVETDEELKVLRTLNVDAAMGYLLGRPGPEISLT